MNPIQRRLLDIAKLHDITKLRRIDLVAMVGCEYPSQITHHLNQLIKRGDLVRKDVRLMPALASSVGLVRIPIMGEADCGEATKYADGRIIGYVSVSPSLIGKLHTDNLYALVARGDSMNRAIINGNHIEDGDYIIVKKHEAYNPKDGDIVISNISGLANVKRFKRDTYHRRIVLVSDSYRQEDYAPIIVSEQDDYNILGQVVEVVKGIGE